MKLAAILLFVFTFSLSQAQNKNVVDETKKTIITVDDGESKKQIVKNENTREVQVIEVDGPKDKTVNRDVKPSPTIVEQSTEIINPDGSVRIVDVDRSNYYTLNGKKYKVELDSQGYSLLSENNKNIGKIRKTTTNSFIFVGKDKTAIAYFDTNGNLVLESYNPKTDTVTFETYSVLKE
jgi:hypothetical protein